MQRNWKHVRSLSAAALALAFGDCLAVGSRERKAPVTM